MTLAASIAQSGANNVTMRNKIINGNMMIDQRNAGASYSQINGAYSLDRWAGFSYSGGNVTGKYTVQQNAGSVTPPAGFTNYLGVTSSAATSLSSADIFSINQTVEGYNVADLGWGSANAKTITISFWVRSSIAGTYGVLLRNDGGNRAYATTYTINSTNTWEQKSVTIAGDQSGTWLTTNGAGIVVCFQLQTGSIYATAPNSWTAGNYYGSTGCVSLLATSGATWQITGVQLEAGTTATPFEQRLYGTELALCQRYCQIITRSSGSLGVGSVATKQSGSYLLTTMTYQTMRTSPTWANSPSSWDITGSPSATQAYAYDFAASGFVSINSGSLSVINQLTASQGRFYVQSSTTFSGSAGGVFAIGLGADMILTAEL